jgi:protein subunit release factor B
MSPQLLERLQALRLQVADFSESFVRSAGHGGQNVNKVSTCVQLTHLPSGISVKCMEHRSQAQNRETAWRRLLDKMEEARRHKALERQDARERQRRRNRRPSKAARARNVEAKRVRAQKKQFRTRPGLS